MLDFDKARGFKVKKDDMDTKIVAAFVGAITLIILGNKLTRSLFLVTSYRTKKSIVSLAISQYVLCQYLNETFTAGNPGVPSQ